MKLKVLWLKKALRDLEDIFDFISRDSKDIALSFVKEIYEKTKLLSEFPEIGRVSLSSSLENNLREFVIHKNYIIIYRLKSDRVEILQIWHVARNKK